MALGARCSALASCIGSPGFSQRGARHPARPPPATPGVAKNASEPFLGCGQETASVSRVATCPIHRAALTVARGRPSAWVPGDLHSDHRRGVAGQPCWAILPVPSLLCTAGKSSPSSRKEMRAAASLTLKCPVLDVLARLWKAHVSQGLPSRPGGHCAPRAPTPPVRGSRAAWSAGSAVSWPVPAHGGCTCLQKEPRPLALQKLG